MSFRAKVRTKYILADYQKWQGTWVHYSKHPELTVNPQQFHQDPAGIYLFPEAFKAAPMWSNKPYKFLVEVPRDLKVLDLAAIDTAELALRLLDDTKTTEGKEYDYFKEQILETKEPADRAWEYLQRYFLGKPGAFNKRLREAGYEAVFDDIKAIHSNEVQLLVLNPTRIKIKEREQAKSNGYQLVAEIAEHIKKQGAKWAIIRDDKTKRKKDWGDYRIIYYARIASEDDTKAVSITVSASPDFDRRREKHAKATKISYHADNVKPYDLEVPQKLKYYDEEIQNVDIAAIKAKIDGLLKHIFEEK